jgi:hypothetical protein
MSKRRVPPPVPDRLDWLEERMRQLGPGGIGLTSGPLEGSVFGPQPAHYALIGPTSGAADEPTFRALVAGDIPLLGVAQGGTGLGTYAVGDLIYASGAAALSRLAAGAAGTVLVGTGAAPAWSATPTLSSLTLDSPDSMTAGYTALTLPASDATKGPFVLTYNQSVVSESVRDPYIRFGYNVTPTGARVHTGDNQGAMFITIEGDWKSGGVEATELHVESVDASGSPHRLLSFNTVNATGAATAVINANQFVVYDKNNNTPMFNFTSGTAGTPASAQMVLVAGNFYFGQFGSELKAINFAGSQYLPIIGLDPYRTRGDNVLVLGWPVLNATQTDAYLAGRFAILNQTANQIPLTVQAKSAQSVALTRWLASDGTTVLASVDQLGTMAASPSGLATTSTDGVVIQNTTAATAGVPVQQSGRLRLRSNVWNTTATAQTNTDDWWLESVPVTGATPSGLLKVGQSLNGAGATFPLTLTSGGVATFLGQMVVPSILLPGANGQAFVLQALTELTTIAAAPTTDTAIQMPANSIVFAVSVRVVTVIPTAATFTVGDAGNAARFNTAAVNVAAGSTDKGTAAGAYYNAAAAAVRITPDVQPGAATGQVRVTIHYLAITAPTS